MNFENKLISGIFIKRYKRFFVDVQIKNKLITAHCPNTGSMQGLLKEGNKIWLSKSNNPNRKLKYTLQIIEDGNSKVGVNTHLTNKIVLDALENNLIREFSKNIEIKPEVKFGENTRFDFLITDKNYKEFELFGIQCKTNFADDVERPLLYQILYNLPTQLDIGIKIGVKGTHVSDFKNFKYSFVTIPSQKADRIPNKDTAPAIRAQLFSGGCYWAMQSKNGVANSLKEFMNRNFSSVLPQGNTTIINNLDENIANLKTKYKYFKLNY